MAALDAVGVGGELLEQVDRIVKSDHGGLRCLAHHRFREHDARSAERREAALRCGSSSRQPGRPKADRRRDRNARSSVRRHCRKCENPSAARSKTISPVRSRTVTGAVTSFTRTRMDDFCLSGRGVSGWTPGLGVKGPGGAPWHEPRRRREQAATSSAPANAES